MPRSDSVGKYRDASPGPKRTSYTDALVGDFRELAPASTTTPEKGSAAVGLRLIYLDRDGAAPCIERLAATSFGQEALAPVTGEHPDGVLDNYNAAYLFEHIAGATRPWEAFDLCAGMEVRPGSEDLHPGQVLLLRGKVPSAGDVLPSSLLLTMTAGSMRVLVDRTQGLHLNQRYLARREVRAIGVMHSVPKTQLRAVALFSVDPQTSESPAAENPRS